MHFIKVWHLRITCNFCRLDIRRYLGLSRFWPDLTAFFDTFVKKCIFQPIFNSSNFFQKIECVMPSNPRIFFLEGVTIKWSSIWWSWRLRDNLNWYPAFVEHLHHGEKYVSISPVIFFNLFFSNISDTFRNNSSPNSSSLLIVTSSTPILNLYNLKLAEWWGLENIQKFLKLEKCDSRATTLNQNWFQRDQHEKIR